MSIFVTFAVTNLLRMTDGYSRIPAKERLDALKALMPEVFDEDKIDWEKLKATLGEDVSFHDERYVLSWAGKSDAFRTLQQATSATLVPSREESVDFDKTNNIFIEGDNLDALKILQRSYFRKVKMIYIDPPYNTGGDSFVYADDFSENREDYLRRIGEKDKNGMLTASGEFKANGKDKGHYHSNWLNMMMPLMYLAKSLMKDDGVIFVSIDDNEVYNLRMLMNEVFGEENFVAQFIWEKRLNRENRKEVSVRHDYILCYSKYTIEGIRRISQLPMNAKALANYGNPDNDPRGLWKSDPAHAQAGHGTKAQFYTLIAPNGKKYELPSGRCWLYTEDEMKKAIADNRIWFGKDGNGVPRVKTFLNSKERGLTPETMIFNKDILMAEDASTNEKAKNDLKDLFDGVAVFDTPKPIELIKLLLKISTTENDLVLDFFAGCGSTGHAVMSQNLEDRSNRKFICVQIDEAYDKDSEAYKAGYKNIPQVLMERLRRAGKLVKEEAKKKIAEEKEQLSFGDSTNTQIPDTGFKVFKVAKSNFKQWQHIKGIEKEKWQKQLLNFTESLTADAKNENVVYELMLKNGVDLNASVKHEGDVYLVDGKRLCLMLEKADQQTIDNVLAMMPEKVIALDRLFEGNDQLLTNTSLQMKDAKIDFETI